MSIVVRFSPDLAPWLVDRLDRGHAADALVGVMAEQGMVPQAARAIVSAFLAARSAQRPLPTDSVTVDEDAFGYVYDAPIARLGRQIDTFDRSIPVLARLEKPVLAVLGEVLSAEECQRLIERARSRLETSTVVDPSSGEDVVADYRKSSGMFFRLEENPFIARLDRRIAEVMNLPVDHGEGLQVLRYPTGGGTAPHFDFLVPSNAANQASIARSGQRVSSLIIYLNDVGDGGETSFPTIGWSILPRRGNAVYFEYCNRLGQLDQQSLHAGDPVGRGEKWVATKWMRERRFMPAGAAGSEGTRP